MITEIEFLTLCAAYIFIIYGLIKAVEDRDDPMIMVGILVQILISSEIVFWLYGATGSLLTIPLIGPVVITGIYPVLLGIRRNLILPAEIQIEIESSLDVTDPEPFRLIPYPRRRRG